ncbi:L,D-transpeptidase family protein [Paracoccus tegillarcae]|uniref:Murein L,D-transpeptidase n=1 Tax=Paracoccus tegillarcae TaxID=1529068 RepID=A0A2K9EF89_9RHOB|nr:L,D-transpeptidase [Paracoccus tegillarcae]AUH33620.1 murein L,D-transpeptidase [Paracoccus tegillarcae]
MPLRRAPIFATLCLSLLPALLASTAIAQQQAADSFSAAQIDGATYTAGDLASGRSALTAKIQILLDRSGTSPGVIDGYKGGMSESAIRAFERRAGLPVDGIMDPSVWNLLQPYAATPVTQDYTITQADAEGLVDAIPVDYAEKAQMSTLAYTSVAEKLGERFHMDDKFIAFLNPGVALVPGSTIKVTAPSKPIKAEVTRIIIDKATRRVAGYDANGDMVVDYPATVGSDATPSPSGNHTVVTIAFDPNYTYNPKVNFKQGENDKVLTIPPGPNGPVGNVWIDLSKPTYGIHGTPTPSRLFVNQSNGCVRLTNWDARELANMVKPGVTTVEFLQPGTTIAEVTGATSPETPEAVASTAAATAVTAEPATTATPTTSPATDTAATVAEPLPANDATTPAVTTTTLPAPATSDLPAAATAPLPDAVHEDTTESEARTLSTPEEDQAISDALSDALSNALSDSAPLPLPEAGQE